jgi:uncharacterized GH25 family protein
VRMKMTECLGLAAVLIMVTAGNAAAHYAFIVPEKFRMAPGESITIGFHAADGFPDSTQVPRRVQSAVLHTSTVTTALGDLREDGMRLVATAMAPSGYFILTAVNPANTAEMRPNSFLDYLKEESLTHVIEQREKLGEAAQPGRERYSMYLKSIVLAGTPNEGYKQIVGSQIEIVPEKDPAQVKAGDSLPVRVLFKGAPAVGLQLFATSAGMTARNIGKTDASGRIAVPVSAGRWRLHTIQMERVAEPKVDWESFWATLTFEIPQQ